MSSKETVTENHDSDFPRSWRWDEDGLRINGTYVRMDTGPTEYGQKAICVLSVDGQERSLWLAQEALISKFRDELKRRAAADFSPGERIIVEREAEKKESAAGRRYWPFRVSFPEAPRRTASDLLGLTDVDESGEEERESTDDDIPF